MRYPRFEILVVNNGSDSDDLRRLAEQNAGRYIHVPEPGLSRARNAAARASQSELIAFLDDDSVSDPQWLNFLAAEFQDPEVMAVTGRIDTILGNTEAERVWEDLNPPENERARRVSVDNRTDQWFEKSNFGGVGMGGNMAIRRSAWDSWPGFDERLGRGAILNAGEENFAFFALVSRGYRVVYAPQAVIAHAAPTTMQDLRRRYIRDLSAATGYMTLLFVEYPQHRRQLIHFLRARMKKTPRDWRERRPSPHKIIPKWRAIIALLYGPFLYFRMRLSRVKSNR